MRKLSFLSISLAALVAAGPVQADRRVSVQSQGCGEIKSVIRAEGAVILRWVDPRSGQRRSDRYVANASHCKKGFFIKQDLIHIDAGVCGLKQCVDADQRERRRLVPNPGGDGSAQPSGQGQSSQGQSGQGQGTGGQGQP